jgi:voltage-gated potassium channel
VLAVIFGTVHEVQEKYGRLLYYFEVYSVAVFTVEYIARTLTCVVDSRFSKPLSGRIRFAIQFMSLVDLLAILPFYLPFAGVDLRAIRVLRLLSIVRVAKVGRCYYSLNLIKRVFGAKKEELTLTTFIMLLLLVFAASVLYYCEVGTQPEVFKDIPTTFWWAVITLTSVGYGDVTPVTSIGKFFASIIAVLGIGMFALPTGIIGSGFVEEIQKRKNGPMRCPYCGGEII